MAPRVILGKERKRAAKPRAVSVDVVAKPKAVRKPNVVRKPRAKAMPVIKPRTPGLAINVPLRHGSLDERVVSLIEKSFHFPLGARLPPNAPVIREQFMPFTRESKERRVIVNSQAISVPLPESAMPFSRVGNNSDHFKPLFPPPSPFRSDPARYLRPDGAYIGPVSKVLPKADGAKRFFASNGRMFSDLKELHDGLLMMKDDHFRHHVNEEKNDFANWVADVLGEHSLSQSLRQVRSRALSAYRVGERVRQLRRHL